MADQREPSPDLVQDEIPCRRCGYLLRLLPLDGNCPECGAQISPSLSGRRLINADQRWLRTIRIGALLFGISLMVVGLMCALTHRGILPGGGALPEWGIVCSIAVSAIGAFFLTRQEPDGPFFDERRLLRRIMRLLILPTVAGVILATTSRIAQGYIYGGIYLLLCMLAGIILMQLVPWYLASLSRRVPSRPLKIAGRLAGLTFPITYASIIVIAAATRPGSGILTIMLASIFIIPAAYALTWSARIPGHPRPKLTDSEPLPPVPMP